MLEIKVEANELFDSKNNEFIPIPQTTLRLEHSLLSISKWESKYHKSFFSDQEKTKSEVLDYIKFMALDDVDKKVYSILSVQNFDAINNYLNDSCSATTFSNARKDSSNSYVSQRVTSELIYYWMVFYGIPFDCEKWNIKRLLNLIRICKIQNETNNKMGMNDLYAYQRNLNQMRHASMHAKG